MTTSFARFEDSALIELALEGKPDCFAVLMERHLSAVRWRIGQIVRNQADLDDILQEVMLKVWRHLSTFRAESTLRTWMIRVGINEALQYYRRERHRQCSHVLEDLDAVSCPAESAHESLTRGEGIQEVHDAMARMPLRYRQVLMHSDLQELSAREAAQRLQITIPALKTRLFRARAKLSMTLKRSRMRLSNPRPQKLQDRVSP